MSTPGRDDGGGSPTVSALTVPLLLAGLVIGFLSGYLFLWWGLIPVAVVVLAGVSMVISGRSREAATALLLGTVASYLLVLLLAVFRGIL